MMVKLLGLFVAVMAMTQVDAGVAGTTEPDRNDRREAKASKKAFKAERRVQRSGQRIVQRSGQRIERRAVRNQRVNLREYRQDANRAVRENRRDARQETRSERRAVRENRRDANRAVRENRRDANRAVRENRQTLRYDRSVARRDVQRSRREVRQDRKAARREARQVRKEQRRNARRQLYRFGGNGYNQFYYGGRRNWWNAGWGWNSFNRFDRFFDRPFSRWAYDPFIGFGRGFRFGGFYQPYFRHRSSVATNIGFEPRFNRFGHVGYYGYFGRPFDRHTYFRPHSVYYGGYLPHWHIGHRNGFYARGFYNAGYYGGSSLAATLIGATTGAIIGAEIDGGYDRRAGALIGATAGAIIANDALRDDYQHRGGYYTGTYSTDAISDADEMRRCLTFRFQGNRYVCVDYDDDLGDDYGDDYDDTDDLDFEEYDGEDDYQDTP